MSTSVCPSCGAEYLAGVAECADCLVLLVQKPGADATDATGAADAAKPAVGAEVTNGHGGGDRLLGVDDEAVADSEEQVAYELDEYDPTIRRLVGGTLTDRGIPHVWEGTTLVVRSDDEDAVDAIIDEIDEGSEAAAPTLDPGAEQVVYDVADWSDEQRDELVARLETAGIPYEWDDNDDLAVLAADEDAVEATFDSIEFPDALAVEGAEGAEGDDGLVTQEILSELFVAADRLAHDPRNHEGVLALVDAARLAASLPLPFGFSPPTWKNVIDRAMALRRSLEEDEEDDDVILEQARTLRNVVRQFT